MRLLENNVSSSYKCMCPNITDVIQCYTTKYVAASSEYTCQILGNSEINIHYFLYIFGADSKTVDNVYETTMSNLIS